MRRERGTSQLVMAKSVSIKSAERKFGDCAGKAVELTSGDLQASVPESGLGKSEGDPIGLQKSAAGIVRRKPEGPNGGRDVSVNLKDERRQKIQSRLACAHKRKGEARTFGREGSNRPWRDTKSKPGRDVDSRLGFTAEPPCADPHARWCGRGRAVRLPPIPILAPRSARGWGAEAKVRPRRRPLQDLAPRERL
jgi:hypothetical protein